MISQAESSKSLTEINGYNIFSSFDKVKDFLSSSANNFPQKTQQVKASLRETADKAADTVAEIAQQAQASIVEDIEKTKNSLEQTLQTTGQIKTTTSDAVQTAINSSMSDWLQSHTVVLRLVQLLAWGSNHPILSLIILVLGLAIAFSLIKAIGSLFEKAWLSILQAPLKLGHFLLQVSSRFLGKFGSLMIKPLIGDKNIQASGVQSFESNYNPAVRLLEISHRLESIHKEQNELLKEAATILNLDVELVENNIKNPLNYEINNHNLRDN